MKQHVLARSEPGMAVVCLINDARCAMQCLCVGRVEVYACACSIARQHPAHGFACQPCPGEHTAMEMMVSAGDPYNHKE